MPREEEKVDLKKGKTSAKGLELRAQNDKLGGGSGV